MAFQRGSQINPALGRTDFTPFLQGSLAGSQMAAQGAGAMGQGLAGLMSGVGQGIDAYKRNKEESKKLEGFIKAAEKMSSGFEAIADKLDPRITQSITGARQTFSDPALSVKERASAAQSFLQQAPALLNGGFKMMEMEQQSKEQQAREAMAAQKFLAQQQAQARNQMVQQGANAVAMGGNVPSYMPNAVFNEATLTGRERAAKLGKAEMEAKPAPANGYATAEEALKAAQALKLPAGQEPSFRLGPDGRYFPAAVVRPPEQVEDPERKASVGMMTKQFEGDIAAGDTARRTMPQVGRLLRMLSTGELETGKLAEFKANANAWAKAFGAEIDETKLANAQEAQAYFPQFIFEQIQRTKGAITEKENALFQEMGPMLGRSPDANTRLLEMIQGRFRLDMDIARIAAEASRGSITFAEAAKKRDELRAKYDSGLPDTFAKQAEKTDGFSPDVFKFIKGGKK